MLAPVTPSELLPAADVARLADHHAARATFEDYTERKAPNTRARYLDNLRTFAEFLAVVGIQAEASDLFNNPAAWSGVSFGLVESFKRWMLQAGYAIATVNMKLTTVRTFARLAHQAGALGTEAYTRIANVTGYSRNERAHVDQGREARRLSTKKESFISLTPDQARQLRAQPDTPQGRRDALLVALMLDLGLRVGEVEILTREGFDLAAGRLTLHRPKVNIIQTHRLPDSLWDAARRYLETDAPASGPVLRASRKGGKLGAPGMSRFAIQKRVAELGARIGVSPLGPHDLRHSWATHAARAGTPIDALMHAGGWNSPSMPLRYVEAAAIANEGVRLVEARTE